MRALRFLAVGVIASTSCVTTARGVEAIFDYGPVTTTRTDGGLVAGQSFFTFGPITFNSLGFIDVGEDGLSGSYLVGIFDQSQTLLASTTVTPGSQLIDGFRYESISPVTIATGQTFTIAALIPPSPADPWLEVQWVALGVGIAGSGLGQYDNSLSITYPTTPDDAVYAVVNASTEIVPEPASLGMVVAGAALMLRRHRRGD